MASVRTHLILTLPLLTLAACASGQKADNGGGGGPDARVSSFPDANTAGTPDSAPTPDAPALPDARMDTPDAMASSDAAPGPDAPPPADAGPPSDSGATTNVCTEAQPYAVNDFCNMAMDLTTDATSGGADVFGDTTNYANDLEPDTACTSGFGLDGPDAIYRVDATAGQVITATVTPQGASFDTGMYILPDCTVATPCLTGVDDVAGTGAETLTYTATTTGSYFIIVDSYLPSEYGCYEFQVSVQ